METLLKPPYLPPEILEEIFLRLPIKSLVRFQLLSRSWACLFYEPKFLLKYHDLRIGKGPTSLVIAPEFYHRECLSYAFMDLDDHDDLYDVIVNFQFPTERPDHPGMVHPRLVGSWNGLVALHDGVRTFVLWNPCTNDCNEVTIQGELHDDLFSSLYLLGLCYDGANDEYMVVVLNYYTEPPPLPRWYNFKGTYEECQVGYLISFRSGKYEELTSFCPIHRISFSEQVGVIVNGIPHWLDAGHLSKIYCFDHTEKDFKEMSYPNMGDSKVLSGLGALHGQLSVAFQYPNDQDGTEFEIWAMKDYGIQESWTKLFVIPQEAGLNSYDLLSPLGFTSDGKIVVDSNGNIDMSQDPIKHRNQLMAYNPREKKFQEIVASRFGRGYSKATYVPTLLSPY